MLLAYQFLATDQCVPVLGTPGIKEAMPLPLAVSWRIERQPSIEQVQALADNLHSMLRCHSNETRAPIANPSNSA